MGARGVTTAPAPAPTRGFLLSIATTQPTPRPRPAANTAQRRGSKVTPELITRSANQVQARPRSPLAVRPRCLRSSMIRSPTATTLSASRRRLFTARLAATSPPRLISAWTIENTARATRAGKMNRASRAKGRLM